MNIKLNSISIDNFKGIKKFQTDFDSQRTIIKAENGVGKTTIFDAFLWLLFGKDSTGRKDFGIRPLDKDNNAIKGIVAAVTAELEIDGQPHTFKKEHTEIIVKKQFKGYETSCYVDEVPKKVSEYTAYIQSIIPEDVFKMLTNLRHFNELHWKERRAALVDMAGETGTPKGFDELLGELNDRTIDEYKEALNLILNGNGKSVKGYKKEQAEIPLRIDEKQKGLSEYAENGKGVIDYEKQRTEIQAKIKKLDDLRADVYAQENERLQKKTALDALQSKKIQREGELKTDTSGIMNLLKEKSDLESLVAVARQEAVSCRSNIALKSTQIQSKQSELTGLLDRRQELFEEYKKAEDIDPEAGINSESDVCFNCGQTVPEKMLKANEEKKQKAIAEAVTKRQSNIDRINKQREELKISVDKVKAEIEIMGAELKTLNDALASANAEFQKAEADKTKRFAEIEKAIKENPTTPPEQDKIWQNIVTDIAKAQEEIGEPVHEQLQAIDNKRTLLNNELAEINTTLAQADRAAADKKRIAELEQQEKDLAQKIADVEKQLNDIRNYNMESCKLLDKAVNGRFKHVTFKLFEYQLNGEIVECCEATLNGVTYSDLSYGQKIFVGIDIINTLSNHYGVKLPLWIDNAEGLTLQVEFDGQTIQLFAQSGISKLTVETSAESKTTKSKTRKVA
jgi:chromosome segregation ATPase